MHLGTCSLVRGICGGQIKLTIGTYPTPQPAPSSKHEGAAVGVPPRHTSFPTLFCWGARSTSPHTTSHPIPNSFLLGATVGVSPRHTSPTQQTHNSFDYTWSTRKASLCMGCDCVCFVCLSVGYNSCFFFLVAGELLSCHDHGPQDQTRRRPKAAGL